MESINALITDNEILKKIQQENQRELVTSSIIHNYLENYLLPELNKIMNGSNKGNKVNQAIFILLAQGINSFNTSLLLALNGYFSNSIILARNSIDVIFNIKYILNEPATSTKRASRYLSKPTGWTDMSISKRSYETLDKPLYQLYKLFSNYTHSNYLGAAQNFSSDNVLSVHPTEKKATVTINCINSLCYYLIQNVTKYYNIECIELDMTEELKNMVDFYNLETNLITNFFYTPNIEINEGTFLQEMKKFRRNNNIVKNYKVNSRS